MMISVVLGESKPLLTIILEGVLCDPCHLMIEVSCLTLIRVHNLMMSVLLRNLLCLNLGHGSPTAHIVWVRTRDC